MTVKELFQTLPAEASKKAIHNTSKEFLESQADSVYESLVDAFYWASTREGGEYWSNICDNEIKKVNKLK